MSEEQPTPEVVALAQNLLGMFNAGEAQTKAAEAKRAAVEVKDEPSESEAEPSGDDEIDEDLDREALVQRLHAAKAAASFMRSSLEAKEAEIQRLQDLLHHKLVRHDTSSSVSSDSSDASSEALEPQPGRALVGTQEVELEVLVGEMKAVREGVTQQRYTHKMKTFHNCFTGKNAVDWLVSKGKAPDRPAAVTLLHTILRHGYFHNVPGGHAVKDDDSHFYRFFREMPAKLPVSVERVAGAARKATCSVYLSSLLRLISAIHNNTVLDWLDTASGDMLKKTFPAVLMWSRHNLQERQRGTITTKLYQLAGGNPALRLALLGFQRASGPCLCAYVMAADMHKQKFTDAEKATLELLNGRPAKVAKKYEKKGTGVVHPFTGEKDLTVKVMKEFNSAAKPAWVRFLTQEGKTVETDVVAKAGDDLRKDLAVQLIFQAFEAVLQAEDVEWMLGSAPIVRTYGVQVMGPAEGFLEFMPGTTIKEIEANGEWKTMNLHAFCPSAVGSMVAGFVLGVRDRHSENWMVIGDHKTDPKLTQIDFGYMLMENPGNFPLDTPRLTMQPSLIKQLKKCQGLHGNLLNDFRHDLVTAYGVLRKHHHALISFCKMVLGIVYPPDKVEKFMRGRHSFRSDKTEADAMSWFDEKVHTQLTRFNLRRGAKHGLVKAFYAFQKLF